MENILPLFLIIPIGAAALILLVRQFGRRIPDIIVVLSTLSLLLLSVSAYCVRPPAIVLTYGIGGWLPPVGINLVLDGLSQLLVFIISLVAFMIAFYSIPYLDKYTARGDFYALFMLMVAGMNGVVLTGDLFTLFIFLELASISSAVLVAFGTGAEETEAALKYLIIGTVASLLILLGTALLYNLTGTLNLADLALSLQSIQKPAKLFIAVLFLMGFLTKAAVVPFHAWLPDAHPAAPAPISAMLSGVLIKALGVYALIRIFYNVFGLTPQLSFIMTALGAISILVGVLSAIGQWDFKRLLAYHSISQIGYIILGLGLATPLGIMGGLFHLFNHALFKSLLFLNAGAVEYQSGSRNLKELGGLSDRMPITAKTALVASLSISGIPPFNGFWSKLFIILACVQAGKIGLASVAVLGSILTLASFTKVQKYVFFGKAQSTAQKIKEAHWLMGASMIAFSLLCLVGGILFPFVVNVFINPAVVAVINGVGYGRMVLGGN